MNLESVTGPDGRATLLAAGAAPPGPGRKTVGGKAARLPADTAPGRIGADAGKDTERLIEQLKVSLGPLGNRLGFTVHEGTGQLLAQLVDRKTGEVIRESPPREFLDLAARMKEMVGLFLDEQG